MGDTIMVHHPTSLEVPDRIEGLSDLVFRWALGYKGLGFRVRGLRV